MAAGATGVAGATGAIGNKSYGWGRGNHGDTGGAVNEAPSFFLVGGVVAAVFFGAGLSPAGLFSLHHNLPLQLSIFLHHISFPLYYPALDRRHPSATPTLIPSTERS